MAFRNIKDEDFLKLKLVQSFSVEELTTLMQYKDRLLNSQYNTLDIKSESGEGEFSYVDEEGKLVKVKVPLLNICPIPFISIDTVIPEIKTQYNI